jgi:hypothetical protein
MKAPENFPPIAGISPIGNPAMICAMPNSTQHPIHHLLRKLRPFAAAALLIPATAFADDSESTGDDDAKKIAPSTGDVVSLALTDTIKKGEGTIDLLKNISGADLQKYFDQTGGLLLLGAGLNEANSGAENNNSLGVAIKEIQLTISTTKGDFKFSEVFTSTMASLRDSDGKNASNYYTMFGQNGKNELSGEGSMDLTNLEDVMWMTGIDLSGTIKEAKLEIRFVTTPDKEGTVTEDFFDFSGGFENFALLSAADAALLESQSIGEKKVSDAVKFTNADPVSVAIAAAIANENGGNGGNGGGVVVPPGAPNPPLMILAGMGLLMVWRNQRQKSNEKAA